MCQQPGNDQTQDGQAAQLALCQPCPPQTTRLPVRLHAGIARTIAVISEKMQQEREKHLNEQYLVRSCITTTLLLRAHNFLTPARQRRC